MNERYDPIFDILHELKENVEKYPSLKIDIEEPEVENNVAAITKDFYEELNGGITEQDFYRLADKVNALQNEINTQRKIIFELTSILRRSIRASI